MAELSESSFRIGGLVSGLKTDDIVSQLMEIERAPVKRLESKKTDIQTKLTAWRDLNTRILALSTAANRLKNESSFAQREATSSNPDILTVSASPGKSIASQMIKVHSLSTNHQVTTQSYASPDESLGVGTLNIRVGASLNYDIQLTEENNTLEGLRDEINSGNYGVSATLVKTSGENYQLLITSNKSGESGALTLDANLSGGTAPTFATIQEARDAHITLGEGASAIEVYRSGNTLTDVIDGVIINLMSADPDKSVIITLGQDPESARGAIDNFITQFNNLVDYFDQQFFYNKDTNESGTLFSDPTLLSIKNELYSTIIDITGGQMKFRSIDQIGISMGQGGKLYVKDEAALSNALEEDLGNVSALFTDNENGIAVKVNNYLDDLLDSSSGILKNGEDLWLSQIRDIDDSIAKKEEYLSIAQTQYYKKFTDLESALAKIQSQSSYMQYQLDAMFGASNNSGGIGG